MTIFLSTIQRGIMPYDLKLIISTLSVYFENEKIGAFVDPCRVSGE